MVGWFKMMVVAIKRSVYSAHLPPDLCYLKPSGTDADASAAGESGHEQKQCQEPHDNNRKVLLNGLVVV